MFIFFNPKGEEFVGETDIPIFTEQFLQHNKVRESELKQLRKANSDYEQQVNFTTFYKLKRDILRF